MKTGKIFSGMILLLLLAGCGTRYTITTKIYPDGSCERIMSAVLEAQDLKSNPFNIRIDSTWECDTVWEEKIETSFGSTDTVSYATITVRKMYPDIASMNFEFDGRNTLSEKAVSRITGQRKFRWFNTIYELDEIYIQRFPFHTYPLSDYLTPLEKRVTILDDSLAAATYFSGMSPTQIKQAKKRLEEKTEAFITDNIFVEFREIIDTLAYRSDSPGPEQGYEEIYQVIKPCLLRESTCDDTTASQLLSRLDQAFETTRYSALLEIDPGAFRTFDAKFQIDYFDRIIDSYTHRLELPGRLLYSNADTLSENIPEWQFGHINFVFEDYQMRGIAAKTNVWAYLVSLLVVLTGVFFTIRRNRKP